MQDNYAVKAVDVDLSHNTLRPFRERLEVRTLNKNTKRVYFDDCCWQEFDNCQASFCRLTTFCDRAFATGLYNYPVQHCGEGCKMNWKRLGVPRPDKAPGVTGLGAGGFDRSYNPNTQRSMDEKLEQRVYVYTYVNSCCDEGAPSDPSNLVFADDGGAVSVYGFAKPPKEYGIEKIRIYRMSSPAILKALGTDNFAVEHSTLFVQVGEIKVSSSTFVDDVLNMNCGGPLTTIECVEPPADLSCITVMNNRELAGITEGNKVRFSLPFSPHNWNDDFELTFPEDIVGLATLGTGLIAFGASKTNYAITEIRDCKEGNCRDVTPYLENLTVVNPCLPNQILTTPLGVIFVSSHGLVLANERQQQVITSKFFSPSDWRELHPDQMTLGFYDSSVFFSTPLKTFRLGLGNPTDSLDVNLIEISDKPDYIFSDGDKLFFAEKGKVYQWDAGNSYRRYHWESKRFNYPIEANWACARVRTSNRGNQVDFYLIGDDYSQIHKCDIALSDKFRLPCGRSDDEFSVIIHGDREVYSVSLASSMRDLA